MVIPALAGLLLVVATQDERESEPSTPRDGTAAPREEIAAPAPTPTPSASARPAERGGRPEELRHTGFLSWAMLNRDTGKITGSANRTAPSDTMSMIKTWLAADYLRRRAERGERPGPTRLRQLARMIRDSDNAAGDTFFGLVGAERSIRRLIRICRLTETRPTPGYWSRTTVSARDTVRIGLCLADGRAAGKLWTPWLLTQMRHVRGAGDFGPRAALPRERALKVAIKNGWLLRDEDKRWHIACLAIGEKWVLGVLARYPARLGFTYGARLCRDVGKRLLIPAPPPRAARDGVPR